jgi:hypothetical protein
MWSDGRFLGQRGPWIGFALLRGWAGRNRGLIQLFPKSGLGRSTDLPQRQPHNSRALGPFDANPIIVISGLSRLLEQCCKPSVAARSDLFNVPSPLGLLLHILLSHTIITELGNMRICQSSLPRRENSSSIYPQQISLHICQGSCFFPTASPGLLLCMVMWRRLGRGSATLLFAATNHSWSRSRRRVL